MAVCYCGAGKDFSQCCEPYITGILKAPSAEALMRSRYSAYAVHNADYLWTTTAQKERKHQSKAAILEWAKSNHWLKLEVLTATKDVVEFKAYYLDSALRAQVHHERSRFIKERGSWYYKEGTY
jgi:SEC-C motif-containing protein